MPTIRELLTARGLQRIAARIQAMTTPSIRFTATTENEGACNRIGGRPNLPRGLDWPQWEDRLLAFLAQFDLATLPEIPGFDLPRTGSLFFFHEGGESPWRYDPKHRGSAQVLYSDQRAEGVEAAAAAEGSGKGKTVPQPEVAHRAYRDNNPGPQRLGRPGVGAQR